MSREVDDDIEGWTIIPPKAKTSLTSFLTSLGQALATFEDERVKFIVEKDPTVARRHEYYQPKAHQSQEFQRLESSIKREAERQSKSTGSSSQEFLSLDKQESQKSAFASLEPQIRINEDQKKYTFTVFTTKSKYLEDFLKKCRFILAKSPVPLVENENEKVLFYEVTVICEDVDAEDSFTKMLQDLLVKFPEIQRVDDIVHKHKLLEAYKIERDFLEKEACFRLMDELIKKHLKKDSKNRDILELRKVVEDLDRFLKMDYHKLQSYHPIFNVEITEKICEDMKTSPEKTRFVNFGLSAILSLVSDYLKENKEKLEENERNVEEVLKENARLENWIKSLRGINDALMVNGQLLTNQIFTLKGAGKLRKITHMPANESACETSELEAIKPKRLKTA